MKPRSEPLDEIPEHAGIRRWSARAAALLSTVVLLAFPAAARQDVRLGTRGGDEKIIIAIEDYGIEW